MRPVRALIWIELLWYRGYPLSLLNLAISPGCIIAPYLLFARLYGADIEFQYAVAVGLILWQWLSNLIWEVGYGLENDLEAGTLESLLVTPVSIFTILLAKGAVCIFRNLYITASIAGWMLLFNISLPFSWPLFIGLALIGGFALSGFIMVLAGSVLLLKKSESIGVVLQTILGALSGVTIPPRLLPTGLWMISRAIPLTYGIEAARRLLRGQPIGDQVLWLIMAGILYALAGRILLQRAERRMKVTGTTGEF